MIITTPGTCGGEPRIAGRRITVVNILRFIASGMTIDEIAKDYGLTKEQIKEALLWSAEYIQNAFS